MNLPRRLLTAPALLLVAVLVGCASPLHRAPVEERAPAPTAGLERPPVVSEPVKPLPGAENAGKPGYYTVKPGDTLIRISLESGQNWRDLVKWNELENPNLIEVGQVLRVIPPAADAASVSSKPITAPKVEARPLDAKPASAPASSTPPAPVVSLPTAPAASAAPAAQREPDDDVNWQWPASGAVVGAFEEGKRKGVLVAGKAGDPVFAAADGKVVYAGSGLRGYGNLIIIKHNASYLTAYAHNQTLLVKEDQSVRRGQKIAEMGASDTDRVGLHFEIRRQGKPVDPLKFLPPK